MGTSSLTNFRKRWMRSRPDTMHKSAFCPLFFPYFLAVFFVVFCIVFSSTTATIPVVSAEDKEPKSSSESSPKFYSTGFPDISLAKHFANENERLAKLTNPLGRKKLNVVLVTCEFDGPTNNGGIGTQFTALAKLYAKNGNFVTVVFTEGER